MPQPNDNEPVRIYVDTEFMDDGRSIELLSLGAVRADGEEFYAVNIEAEVDRADPWVQAHVLPHLRAPLDRGDLRVLPRKQLADQFREFCGVPRHIVPVFWGYYSAYDWVVIAQLYGRLVDLPTRWPMVCLDLKQEMIRQDVSMADAPYELRRERGDQLPEHHALADARWNAGLHRWLMTRDARADNESY